MIHTWQVCVALVAVYGHCWSNISLSRRRRCPHIRVQRLGALFQGVDSYSSAVAVALDY